MGLILLAIIFGAAYFIFSKSANAPSLPISKTEVALAKRGISKRRTSRKFAVIEKPNINLSEESKKILDLLENTKSNIFLTGKAGTGKSTLLKYFRATTKKRLVVLAPTGIAAVNVQGQTIHSFFKFSHRVTLGMITQKYGDGAKMYKRIDMIVIDEISMVRADLVDCIDKFMRLNGPLRNQPFGGVQVVFIGDLHQLPPIVTTEEEVFFKRLYPSPYFFSSRAYPQADFLKFELSHVYRQTDPEFVEALDAFRVGSFADKHVSLMNARFVPKYGKRENEFVISLVTTNKLADAINTEELAKLAAQARIYAGVIAGEFKEQDLPTAAQLILKEGAQVMLLNNHPQGKWVNGDIVKVLKTDLGSVRVLFDDGSFDDIAPYTWDAVKFVFDEETGKIESEIIGSFSQIPLRLAWAITIHKSQGKTFDKVHIDFGNGTFAPGQAYVALSRCRSLEGIVLGTPLESSHIFTDERVREFMKKDVYTQ